MFDIFIIALSLWMYDHAFILQNFFLHFEGRVTHMATNKATRGGVGLYTKIHDFYNTLLEICSVYVSGGVQYKRC